MRKLTFLLVVLIGLLQYRLWFGDGNLREVHRMQGRIVELQQDGEQRRQRNAALEAEVNDLKRGTEAIEESARQNLGMIKEGEVFVQIVDEGASSAKANPPAAKPERPRQQKPAPAQAAPSRR